MNQEFEKWWAEEGHITIPDHYTYGFAMVLKDFAHMVWVIAQDKVVNKVPS